MYTGCAKIKKKFRRQKVNEKQQIYLLPCPKISRMALILLPLRAFHKCKTRSFVDGLMLRLCYNNPVVTHATVYDPKTTTELTVYRHLLPRYNKKLYSCPDGDKQ